MAKPDASRSSAASITAQRAEAVERVLRAASGRLTPDEIVTAIRAEGNEHLVALTASSESVAVILRAWERAGMADKVQDRTRSRQWLWRMK